jgi:hypothetical protein
MRPTLALCVAILLALPRAAVAQGASGVELLLLPVGARPTALGGAYAAAEGLDGIWYNPAALAGAPRVAADLSLLTSQGLFDQTYGAGAATLGANHLALSLLVQRFDAITVMDENAQAQGEISPQTVVVGFTYARWLGPVAAGATAKAIRSDLFHGGSVGGSSAAASGLAFDLGLRAPLGLGPVPAAVAVVLSDAGGTLSYADEDDSAPTRLRAGVAFGPLRLGSTLEVRVMADGIMPRKGAASELAAGAEVRMARILDLRGGGSHMLDGAYGTPAWLGLGLRLGRIRTDLARRFSSSPALGEEWCASLSVGS